MTEIRTNVGHLIVSNTDSEAGLGDRDVAVTLWDYAWNQSQLHFARNKRTLRTLLSIYQATTIPQSFTDNFSYSQNIHNVR